MADEEVQIGIGSVVVLKAGSVAMEVRGLTGAVAHCTWENLAGELVEEDHPVSALSIFDGTNAISEAISGT